MNINADVVRLEGTETGLMSIQRAGSDTYSTDTRKLIRKYANGDIRKWTADEEFSVDAEDVSYTNELRPVISNVEQALNVALGGGDYYADIGVTGVPYWGDGICDQIISRPGSAVYSQDGSVYFLGEDGFTGTSTIAGCRFLITPIKQGTPIQFVDGGNTATSEYSSIGYTGIGTDEAELAVTARTKAGSKANLLLKAYYGKLILQTSATGGGIVLSGNDAEGTAYDAGATGVYRALYADQNGEMVMATSDQAKYVESGWTAACTEVTPTQYNYIKYTRQGNVVSLNIPTWSGDQNNTGLVLQNMPAAIRPAVGSNGKYQPCIVTDEVLTPALLNSGMLLVKEDGGMEVWHMTAGGIDSWWDAATGVVGMPAQTITYAIN